VCMHTAPSSTYKQIQMLVRAHTQKRQRSHACTRNRNIHASNVDDAHFFFWRVVTLRAEALRMQRTRRKSSIKWSLIVLLEVRPGHVDCTCYICLYVYVCMYVCMYIYIYI
jgi:hypothetical protein